MKWKGKLLQITYLDVEVSFSVFHNQHHNRKLYIYIFVSILIIMCRIPQNHYS